MNRQGADKVDPKKGIRGQDELMKMMFEEMMGDDLFNQLGNPQKKGKAMGHRDRINQMQKRMEEMMKQMRELERELEEE